MAPAKSTDRCWALRGPGHSVLLLTHPCRQLSQWRGSRVQLQALICTGFSCHDPGARQDHGWCLNAGPKSRLENAFALPPRFSLRGSLQPSRGRLLVFASGWLGFGLCTSVATQGFSDPVVCGFHLALLPQILSSLQTQRWGERGESLSVFNSKRNRDLLVPLGSNSLATGEQSLGGTCTHLKKSAPARGSGCKVFSSMHKGWPCFPGFLFWNIYDI